VCWTPLDSGPLNVACWEQRVGGCSELGNVNLCVSCYRPSDGLVSTFVDFRCLSDQMRHTCGQAQAAETHHGKSCSLTSFNLQLGLCSHMQAYNRLAALGHNNLPHQSCRCLHLAWVLPASLPRRSPRPFSLRSVLLHRRQTRS
jgi:hypothetical protein